MIVAIVKGPRSVDNVYKSIELAGGFESIAKKFDRALIKVNFISTKTWDTGATTDPVVVEGIIDKAKEVFKEVIVIETDASITNAHKASRTTGIKRLCDDKGIEFVNPKEDKDQVDLIVKNPLAINKITVSRRITDSAIINAAKMKTHGLTNVTLSLKNMFGLLSTRKKFQYHMRNMNKVIPDILSVIKPHFNIIDGFVAMEGRGPIYGKPIEMGVLVSGKDPVSTDSVASKIMGFNPKEIEHIRLTHELGIGEIDLDKIVPHDLTLAEALEHIEEKLIQRALKSSNNIQSRAAEMLGISRRVMHYKIKKYRMLN